jgi:hypothetical protein|tara:strand:+ start:2501 stop:2719 length:219 start_codon:yes stop_codon:yes gene_type:complete
MKNKIGWIGAFLVVLAYFLMTIDIINSNDILYNLINLIAGILLGYRVWLDKNYSNLALEIVFILIAFINLIK